MHTEKNTEGSLFPPEKIKALNAEILNKSKVEEFIPLTMFDDPIGLVEYMDIDPKDYKEFNKESGVFEVKVKPYAKFISTVPYTVTVSMSNRQIQDLNKQHDIDVMSMMSNVQINESAQALTKQYLALLNKIANKNNIEYKIWDKILAFVYKLIKKEYIKKIKIKNTKDLVENILNTSYKICKKSLNGLADFCIVGINTACILQDSQTCISLPLNTSLSSCNGNIYQIGTLANIKVYVDPNLKWDDRSVLLGRKANKLEASAHIVFYDKGTSISLIAAGLSEDINARSILSTKYALFEKGFHPEYNYSRFIYKGLEL